LKKALLYLLFAVLALVLSAGVALYLVVRLALAPGPDEWPARLKLGPATVDVGVPTALRLATSSWFAPWFEGRTIDTAYGQIRIAWNAPANALELECAPCSAQVPALGPEPVRMQRLKVTARRDAGSLDGMIEVFPSVPTGAADGASGDGAIRARWDGRLTQKSLQVGIRAPDAPISRWYALLAPGIPELQRAHIAGTLALQVQVVLPAGRVSVQPQLSQFSVEGLGVEALLSARAGCGTPSRLTIESWLARAVIAAEDPRFFVHPGYELADLTAPFQTGSKPSRAEHGGGTVTQRLAGLLVDPDGPESVRPLRELLYAVELEQTLGKSRILQLYLDNAPWGMEICGAEAAARRYFKRSARNLEPAQAVWLASMLGNPQAALDKWRRDGQVDPERARNVAEGMRGITRIQRDALIRNLASAHFAPP